jgi:hypothetical protein
MPEFRFALTNGDQQFALAPRVELPDRHAVRSHAEAAIKQVFKNVPNHHDWEGWHLSVQDSDDQEFARVSLFDTLVGKRRSVDGG